MAIVLVVYRLITLEELKVLIESPEDLDKGELEEIIKGCGSFLTLREDIIYLVHQSARDFLLYRASDRILPDGMMPLYYAIFRRSLKALSNMLQRNIYSLDNPGFPIDQTLTSGPDLLSSIRYPCIYWVDHLSNSGPAEETREKDLQEGGVMDNFLREKYLCWLEYLSLLYSMSEGVMAVDKLQNIARRTESQRLTGLLQDTYRFILSHKPAIEIAPLQVYISALVFSPARSLVRELFKNKEPDWITVKPSIGSDWNTCL